MLVVGVMGHARSGKDEFCKLSRGILDRKGTAIIQAPFAEKLKDTVHDLYPHLAAIAHTPEGKAALRPIYIEVGKFFRKIDPYTWSRAAKDKIRLAEKQGYKIAVVTDVRFFNEIYDLCRETDWDVRLVRVSATEETQRSRMGAEEAENYFLGGICHDDSEIQLDSLEYPKFRIQPEMRYDVEILQGYLHLITNNQTRDEYESKVLDFWTKIRNLPHTVEPKRAAAAAWRLARQLGPEARLVLSKLEEPQLGKSALEAAA